MKMVWFGGEQVPASTVPGGHCEDAPCCGCCGPGSDDPAYQPEYNPSEDYNPDDYLPGNRSWTCEKCASVNSELDADCQFCDEMV